jgi:hypothetical protein
LTRSDKHLATGEQSEIDQRPNAEIRPTLLADFRASPEHCITMNSRGVALVITVVLALEWASPESAQNLPTNYPAYPPADVGLTIVNGRGHLSSAAAAKYQVIFLVSDSIDGAWSSSSTDIDLPVTQRFFRAVINPGFVSFEGNFWRVDLFGIGMPNNESEFSTRSGFRLKLSDGWIDGVSIYQVESGPSSGDASSDYARIYDDLMTDSRTTFVTPIDTNVSGGGPGTAGQICYLGFTDELFLAPRVPDYTDEELAKLDLQVITRATYSTTVRWLEPKSMRRQEFLQKLTNAGIQADFGGTGCAL